MKMMKRFRLPLIFTVLCCMALYIASCAHIKPISEMAPSEKAVLAMSTYNNIADSYRTRVTLPNLSPAEKRVLQAEYTILQKSWPIISAYDKAVNGTGPPVTAVIVNYINNFLITYRY